MIIGIFAIAVMGLSAFGVQKSLSSNAEVAQLTLDNLEALAISDGGSNTSWSCRGWFGTCSIICGVCKTGVSGRGHVVGSHHCW